MLFKVATFVVINYGSNRNKYTLPFCRTTLRLADYLPLVSLGKLVIYSPSVGALPIAVIFPLCTTDTSWDYLPNKLLTFKSQSRGLLLGQFAPKQELLFFYL